MKQQIILLILSLLAIYTQATGSSCTCPDPDATLNNSITEEYGLSPNDIVIDTVNWQKLVKIGTKFFLQKSSEIGKTNKELAHNCPTGYRGPTQAELEAAVTYATLPKLLEIGFFETGKFYGTSDKPDSGGKAHKEWEFQSLTVSEGDTSTYQILAKSSYFTEGMLTKCMLDIDEFVSKSKMSTYMEGVTDYDLTKCGSYDYTIKQDVNVISQEWIKSDDSSTTESTFNFIAKPDENDCGIFKIHLTLFGGIKLHFCHNFYTLPYFNTGATADKLNSESDIEKIVLTDKLANKINNMHFNQGNAPLAPKPDGGAYILYSEKDTLNLFALEIDNAGAIVNTFNLGCQGKPFDITVTPYGFVFMARDEPHFLYIKGWKVQENTEYWSHTIVNNGNDPDASTVLDQMDFDDAYGTTVMHNPHNGRLIYARGKIFGVFAHYNFFGLKDDGSKDNHTGDTSFFLDAETGIKYGHAFNWDSSHSLHQSTIYDGQFMYTAALGDAFPQSIKNNQIRNWWKTHEDIDRTAAQLIEPDLLPGNGSGAACGRLGQLALLGHDFMSQVHAQRPCETAFNGKDSISTTDKLSILFFDKNFDPPIRSKTLKPGNMVKNVKSAKYGDNILVGYTIQAAEPTGAFLEAQIKDTDTMTVLLVDKQGEILKEISITSSTLSASDDWEVLQDGSVMWTWVNSDDQIELYKVPAITEDTKLSVLTQQCSTGTSQPGGDGSVVVDKTDPTPNDPTKDPTEDPTTDPASDSIVLRFSIVVLGALLAFL